uniref:SET domain-containing protein n=1 Tax=Picocystis salinarum TaxID=88271 RepID=A0A6U9PAY5_9CHLO
MAVAEAPKRSHSQADARLKEFERWLVKMGVTWNREGIEFVTQNDGFGVVAKRNVDVGETLARVPNDACLTARNCCVAEEICNRKLRGGLALSLAIAAERARGKASPWYEYLNVMELPDVPLRWNQKELEELEGTTIDGLSERDALHIQDDFENIFREVVPDLDQSQAVDAVCLFSSRAFGASARRLDAKRTKIKTSRTASIEESEAFSEGDAGEHDTLPQDPHGRAENPGDSGNARADTAPPTDSQTAKIPAGSQFTGREICTNRDNLSVRENGVGCSLASCDDGTSDEEYGVSDSEDDTAEQEEAMVPIADMFNHRVAAVNPPPQYHVVMEGAGQTFRESTVGRERLPNLQIGILEKDDTLLIVALASAEKGSEIWNTYGELGNAELLNRYGFTSLHNPFDTVCIHVEDLLHQVKGRYGERWVRRRMRFVSKVLQDPDDSFDICADSSLEKNLHVFLELLHIPEEGFVDLEPTEESIISLLEDGISIESWETLKQIAERQLNRFPSSLQEDTESLKNARAGSRLHHALVLRMSEKRIWTRFLSYGTLGRNVGKRQKLEIQQYGHD